MKENIHITRNNIAAGELDPVGNITPKFIGQQYIMTSEDKVFFAKGLTSEDWIEASSGGSIKDEPNTKHETVNGEKEFESTEGYIDNVIIEGKTVVNVIDKLYRINGTIEDGVVRTRFSVLGDSFRYNKGLSTGTWTFYNMTDKPIGFVGTNTSDEWVHTGDIDSVPAHSYRTVTLDGTYCIAGVDFRPIEGWSNSDLSIYNETMVMVVEGEHKELPYFKGIYSLGQDSNIDLLTLGEKVDLSDIVWEDGYYIDGPDGSKNEQSMWSYAQDYIPVEDTCEYVMFANKNMCFYDKDKNIIPTSWIGEATTIPMDDYYEKYDDKAGHVIVRPPKGCRYIRINQLTTVKDSTAMYKKSNIKKISTTLRSLPNGVKDTVKKIGDKYYKIQRCGEYTITGNEAMKADQENADTFKPMLITLLKALRAKDTGLNNFEFYCNRLIVSNIYSADSVSHEGIYYSVSATLHIRLAKSKAWDLTSFKNWVKDNPITIVYELESPIVTEIEDLNLRTFKDNTKLMLSSKKLPLECTFESTNSLNNDLDIVKDKIDKLETFIGKLNQQNTRYKTEDGVVEFESKHGYTNNMTMEGKTLVNYIYNVQKSNLTEATGAINTANGTFTKNANGVCYFTPNAAWGDMGQVVPVKANTTYTFGVQYID